MSDTVRCPSHHRPLTRYTLEIHSDAVWGTYRLRSLRCPHTEQGHRCGFRVVPLALHHQNQQQIDRMARRIRKSPPRAVRGPQGG